MSPYRIADAARISPFPRTNPTAQEHGGPLDATSSSTNLASGSSSTGRRGGGSPSKARLVAEAAAAVAAANASRSSTRNADRSMTGNGRQGQQTEERFNIGAPKNPKTFLRRNWRGARSARAALDGIDEGVPNYPPPSFQEATGIPFAASTLTLLAQSSTSSMSTDPSPTVPPSAAEHQLSQSESESTLGRSSPIETPSASESEDSLEIISPQPREGYGHHHGIEFPACPSPSLSYTTAATSTTPSPDSHTSRGRAKTKMASKLDLNDSADEQDEPELEVDPGMVRSSTKKRFLSLSPLRTLFPPKQQQAFQSRALSAHPPGTSPYSAPRSNTHFFRSTTSLASSSVLRFPNFGASTLTLTGNNSKKQQQDDVKSVSGKSTRRSLFPSMSREKEKQRSEDERSDDESIDSWEFLGRDGEVESFGESRRIDCEPRSLMAMIGGSVPESPSPRSPTISSSGELSPTRSLSFTYGATPAPSVLSLVPTVSSSPLPPSSPAPPTPQFPPSSPPTTAPTASSWTEPHPLSLRDRKIQETIQPLLNRKGRKNGNGHHRSKTAPTPIIVPTPPVTPGAGPPVTRVRTRMNQVVNNNQQNDQQEQEQDPVVAEPPTCGVETVASSTTADVEEQQNEELSAAERGDEENARELQRALDTPLPSSPVQSSAMISLGTPSAPPVNASTSASSSPSSVNISISSPTTPVPARGRNMLGAESDGGVQPLSPVAPALKMGVMIDTPTPVRKHAETVECVCKHHSALPSKATNTAIAHPSSRSPSPLAFPPSFKHFDMTPTMSSTPRLGGYRRHYQGRPLPRPPPPPPTYASLEMPPPPMRNAVVDSIYAGHEAFIPSSGSPNTTLVPEGLLIDLENSDDPDISGSWTPPFEDVSHQQLHLASPPITPRRASPIGSLTNSPDLNSVRSLPLSFSSANVSSLSGLSEMTDLEILAATLGDNHHGGDSGRGVDDGDPNDYETLLLISEFLGPADAARNSNIVNMGSSASTDEPNVSLTGRVEVERRRVTADGRIKLKMNMFGVSVNRCGICISQFREGQHGSMSPLCRHIFHENCLRQWLVRSKTCPLCRISLDSGNH